MLAEREVPKPFINPLNWGQDLLTRLPKVRGTLQANSPLAPSTWFRVGGPAEVLFRPHDEDDLLEFMTAAPQDIPMMVLGVASNTLIRDGGVPGIVIRLGARFSAITVEGNNLRVGAGALDLNVARAAETAALAGLEFLSGIPGTVGGGLRMNAGAYGREFKDIVREATLVTRQGKKVTRTNSELQFSYRHSGTEDDAIFLSALLHGITDQREVIEGRMREIKDARSATQPIREKTGGSTFANPESDPEKRKAWQLIDAAGCRGLKRGGAMVSTMHCNFLINTGTATAFDLEQLGEDVRTRVRAQFGIELRWEIKRIGLPVPGEKA